MPLFEALLASLWDCWTRSSVRREPHHELRLPLVLGVVGGFTSAFLFAVSPSSVAAVVGSGSLAVSFVISALVAPRSRVGAAMASCALGAFLGVAVVGVLIAFSVLFG